MSDDDNWTLVRFGDPDDVAHALEMVESLVRMDNPLQERAMVPLVERVLGRSLDVETLALVMAFAQVAAFSVRSWAAVHGASDLGSQAVKGMELVEFMRMHQRADADLASLDDRFPFGEGRPR